MNTYIQYLESLNDETPYTGTVKVFSKKKIEWKNDYKLNEEFSWVFNNKKNMAKDMLSVLSQILATYIKPLDCFAKEYWVEIKDGVNNIRLEVFDPASSYNLIKRLNKSDRKRLMVGCGDRRYYFYRGY